MRVHRTFASCYVTFLFYGHRKKLSAIREHFFSFAENVWDTVPTVGFSTYSLSYKQYSVILYDLGGGPQIRDIWSQYYVDVSSLLFPNSSNAYFLFLI